MRLSTRLSAFFLGALAAVLVGFSAALFASAWYYLHRQVEDRLNAALAVLAAAAEVTPGTVEWEPHERELPLGRDAGAERLRWMVFDDRGHLVDRSANLADAELSPAWSPGPGSTDLPARLRDAKGDAWRIRQRRLVPPEKTAPDAPGAKDRPARHFPAIVLTVAAPVGPTEATLAALGWSLAGLSFGVWIAAAALGRGLVRRALAPLGQMVDSARTIDAADPGWTIPEAGTGDELDELGHAFNDLLARLRVAYERQRRFSGDASHQLRTPLTALVGQIDVALRRERPPEEYRRVLGLVRGQAGNLARIVEALLFLGRADAEAGLPDAEAIDLAAWITAHVAEHGLNGSIDLDLSAGPLTVLAHPALLGELVDNLLDNAAKYGDPGAPIVVRLRDEGGSVALSVEDRGPGIDPADLPRVFEPFFRSDRARRLGRPGVGLGLAVAKRIATALGGSIAVESEPGRGCRFTLSLPKVNQATLISGVESACLLADPPPYAPPQGVSVSEVPSPLAGEGRVGGDPA
ncbi:MAG TPA: ATP-binding protein, partial [Isosphaeraceae bacterium]